MASSLKHLGLVGTAVLLPLTQAPAESRLPQSLSGQLLIASPSMSDPRFDQAVVLVVRHDQNGALGIVINRPVQDRPLAALLEALGEKSPTVTGNVRIFAGGPVQPEIGFVLHSPEYHRSETLDIDGRFAMTSSLQILRDIANKQGPSKSLVAFGYAGWKPDQLEGELRQGAWITAADDEKLIFDEDRDKLWEEAMKRRTQDL